MAFSINSVVLEIYCSSTEIPLSSKHLQSPKMIQDGHYRLSLHKYFHSDKSLVTRLCFILSVHFIVTLFLTSVREVKVCTSVHLPPIRNFVKDYVINNLQTKSLDFSWKWESWRESQAVGGKGCSAHKVIVVTSCLSWQYPVRCSERPMMTPGHHLEPDTQRIDITK